MGCVNWRCQKCEATYPVRPFKDGFEQCLKCGSRDIDFDYDEHNRGRDDIETTDFEDEDDDSGNYCGAV